MATSIAAETRYRSFAAFYPFYISQHEDPTCRRLHLIGSLLVLALAVTATLIGEPWVLLALPVAGYGFAWVGHFGFEKNRPATFTYPLYSLMGDYVMLAEVLIGRRRF